MALIHRKPRPTTDTHDPLAMLLADKYMGPDASLGPTAKIIAAVNEAIEGCAALADRYARPRKRGLGHLSIGAKIARDIRRLGPKP